MFDKILVPTNFSECAHNAAKFACDMLRGQKGVLVLLHATDPTKCTSADEHDRREKHVTESLEAEKSALKAYSPDMEIETEIHEGSFIAMPDNLFDKNGIDLIIIGSDGIEESTRNPTQTNTERFLVRHRRNMIVVPHGTSYMGFGNILFASDYRFHLAGHQLNVLKYLMAQHDSKNFVLHVKKGLDDELGVAKVLEKHAIKQKLSAESPEFHEITAEKIEEGIIKFVNSYNIDLVALIPRKNTLSERIFKNSTTKKVAEKAKKPLLILN